MKRRLFKMAAAAALAVVVALPGGARPAQAFNPLVIKQYVDLANSAFTLIRNIVGSGGSDDAIRNAVRQIIASIEASKVEILTRIDAIAVAEARGCARQAVIEFADIEAFSQQTLQRWAQDVTGCVTLIDSQLDVVTDKAQSDLLGLALNTAGPVALAARARAGFSIDALQTIVGLGNRSLVTILEPTCTLTPLWGDQPRGATEVEVRVRCGAYTAATATDSIWAEGRRDRPLVVPFSSYAHVFDNASNQTSRAVAVAALQILPT